MLDRPAGSATPTPTPAPDRGRGAAGDRPDAASDALSPRALLTTLRRRRVALLANALLWPLFAFIAIAQITPQYTAAGALVYEQSEYKVRELQSILQVDPTTEAVMASQAEILRGLHVVERVAERGNLYDNPEFNRALRPRGLPRRAIDVVRAWFAPAPSDAQPAPTGPTQDASRDATLLAVQRAFDAHTVKSSRVLEVSFTAEDPLVAANAVNNAMDIYIKDQYAAKHRAVERATEWLNKRAAKLRREVRTGEDRIAAYRARKGLAQGMHAGMDAEEISNLAADLVHARSALGNAKAKLDAARGDAGAAAQAAIAPSVVQLRAQQDQISAAIQAQRGRLGRNHPEAISLRRQFADARRAVAAETARVVGATEADLRAARERVATLKQDLRNGEQAADRSATAQVALNAMQRDVEASRQQLQAVLDSIQKTAQQAAIESPEAHEISLALPPGRPSFPRPLPLMAAATAFGLLAGMLLVYVLELADTTLRSGEALRAAAGLPCFALLPEMSRLRLGHLSVDECVARKPLSPFAEQVRTLRAGLWMGAERPRVIAVTAARAGEGKTTVALALARSAALSGEHVLVMECDLRRPTFALRMKATAPEGLADCLRGKLTALEAIRTDAVTSMDVLQAGRIGTDLPDRFLSGTMARMLSDLRERYDLILLDSPPVQAITEARILAGIADATLLCVRWGATPRRVVQHTLRLLEETHAHVVGCTLTRVDAHAHVRSGYADADVYHRRGRKARE
ncbi:MAG TPA: polysaccharide biosynthesis tyrosine autokinase [Acetobacteraceae bacterium]|nr:polysaccharide biosynthesis tyrosine autokinase [Acetobacteraceae bacterium]